MRCNVVRQTVSAFSWCQEYFIRGENYFLKIKIIRLTVYSLNRYERKGIPIIILFHFVKLYRESPIVYI